MAKVNWMSAYILLLNKADPHATTQLWNGQIHFFFINSAILRATCQTWYFSTA